MMKYVGLILFFFVGHPAFCDITARIGFFLPVDHLFKEIYGNVGPTYEIEMSQNKWPSLSLWENLNVTHMDGHSVGQEDRTHIVMGSGSIGVKAFHHFLPHFRGTLGLGAVLSGVWIENHNSSCCKDTSRCTVGGVVKTTLQRHFTPLFHVDAFADYYYLPIHFNEKRDLGGIRAGLGIGFEF